MKYEYADIYCVLHHLADELEEKANQARLGGRSVELQNWYRIKKEGVREALTAITTMTEPGKDHTQYDGTQSKTMSSPNNETETATSDRETHSKM